MAVGSPAVRNGLWLALLATTLIAAPARADLAIESVDVPPEPIAPEVELGLAVVRMSVDCTSMMIRDPPPLAAGVSVNLLWEAPPRVIVVGPSTIFAPTEACMGGALQVPVEAAFNVSIPRTVPGLEPLPLTVRAWLNTDSLDEAEDTAQTNVTAGAFLQSRVEAPVKLRGCSCDELRYDVELTNYGNVRTRYVFEVGTAPTVGRLRLPEPVVLDAPGGPEPSSVQVSVVFEAPSGSWAEAALQVVVRTSAADAPGTEGTPLMVHFLARNTSSLERWGMPLPSAPILLVTLAILAAVRRRP